MPILWKGLQITKQNGKTCTTLRNSFKTKNNKKITVEEDDEIPSSRRLYQLLLELGQKYNRLEEKVDEMNKWVAKKRKRSTLSNG